MSRRVRQLEAALAAEQARVGQLLELLMANAAPANYYAQSATPAGDPAQWLFDETGLLQVPYEDDENDVPIR